MNERGEGAVVRERDDEDRARWEELASRERIRLVRLCARLSGSADAAEDLAQDTLIEAWRHREKLLDSSGERQWLSQIARYVCLRWRRRDRHDARESGRGHRRLTPDANDVEEILADDYDIVLDLERRELSDLLDRAMELVPPGVREILTRHYIEGLEQSELSRLLGTTEGAVAVRVHRGKLMLRRVLLTELQDEAATYGLVRLGTGSWQDTDAWCTMCGATHLRARWSAAPAPGWLTLRCPLCFQQDGVTFHDAPLVHSLPPEVARSGSSYQQLVHHITRWVDSFYRPNLAQRRVACPDCGRDTVLHLKMPEGLPAKLRSTRGLHFTCELCDRTTTQGFEGLIAGLPEVQSFAREHPRYRTLPERHIEVEGQPGIVTAFESVPKGHRIEVVSSSDSYRVLGIHGKPVHTRRSAV